MLALSVPWWVALIIIFVVLDLYALAIFTYLKRWERKLNERKALERAVYYKKVREARERLEQAKLRAQKENEAAGQDIMDKAEEARRDFE